MIRDAACPNCGQPYMDQPSPIQSEMHERNMPAPGEEDTGGNPLKEGILADGGWQNRMKRDESFASVRTAMDDDDWGDDDDENPVLRSHAFLVTPKGQVHSAPYPTTHEQIANEAGLDYSNMVNARYPRGLSLGYLNNDGSTQVVQSASPYQGDLLPRVLQSHFGHPVAVDPNLRPTTNNDRWFGDQDPREMQRENVSPALRPAYEGIKDFEEKTQPQDVRNVLQEHGMDPNVQKADANELQNRMINPAIDSPYMDDRFLSTEEYRRRKVLEQQALKEEGRDKYDWNNNPFFNRGGSFIEDRLRAHASWLISSDEEISKEAAFLGLPALAEGAAGMLGGGEVAGGLLSNPIVRSVGIHGLMNGVMGGGGQAQPQQQVAPAPDMPDEYLSHTAGPLDHPSSLPELGAQEGDDPEAVDQHEVNDGDHANPYDPSVNDQGGTDQGPGDLQVSPETTHKIEMLLPLLVEYFNSPQSGANDPLVKALHEAIEAEHPGYLDAKLAAGPIMAPMTGQPGTGVTPAPQPQSTPPSPNGVGNCAYCGAQLPPGSTVCPQCNAATAGGGVMPQPGSPQANPQLTTPTQQGPPNYYGHTSGMVDPNAGAGAAMMPPGQGDPSMMAPPPMAPAPPPPPGSQGTQGPQTKEQFAAVAQSLVEQNRADEIPNMLQNPDQYADELAEVQQKQPVPQDIAGEQADPTAQQMQAPQAPMEPPVARTAADSIAPKCPQCGSHTTGLMSEEGLCGCHACGHSWTEPLVKSASPHVHEQLHPHVDAPGVPAADQVAQEDPEMEQDSSHLWQTDEGAPLKVGSEYEMYSADYQIPDMIRVTAVKPDAIEYVIVGEYGLNHNTEVTAEEAETMGYKFTPIGPGDEERDETQADAQQFEGPTQGVTDMSVPPRASSRDWLKEGNDFGYIETDIPPDMTMDEYRQCKLCGGPKGPGEPICERCAALQLQNPNQVAPTIGPIQPLHSKEAGKKYTPMEQREFIDEQGEARNRDKLDLKDTHYEASLPNLSPDYFLFGL